MTNTTDPDLVLRRELLAYGDRRYDDGYADGLRIVEKIRGWLTRQPDNEWQCDLRAWVDKLLEEARTNCIVCSKVQYE